MSPGIVPAELGAFWFGEVLRLSTYVDGEEYQTSVRRIWQSSSYKPKLMRTR